MTNRRTRTLAALYGGVAAVALVAGAVGAESGPTKAMHAVSAAPASPGDTSAGGGAVRVHPTICWLGVNCGPINNQPPARGTQHPSTPPAPPPPTPGPQSP
ncbi:hypothetical protein [Mycobacterium numidiamassiliense]|jgi:hypothetical protein|uniref:hypothetical protein n=1 Tax=Mycobacterium numidiamassiliense TaxID=1841861 RepID=UPI00105515A0|nr:hypothetical protein [Mycobacterium numidiamassiliense]